MSMETERKVVAAALAMLVGRRVARVGYMSAAEAAESGWSHRPALVEFDDGTVLLATADEAENEPGVLIVETAESELCLGRLPL